MLIRLGAAEYTLKIFRGQTFFLSTLDFFSCAPITCVDRCKSLILSCFFYFFALQKLSIFVDILGFRKKNSCQMANFVMPELAELFLRASRLA